MNNSDLRTMLFDTIKDLKEGKMDAKTASAISHVAGNILESAKLELDFNKHTESHESSFFISANTQKVIEERVQIELKKRLPENQKFFSELKQA